MLRLKPLLLATGLLLLSPGCSSNPSYAFRQHLPAVSGPGMIDGDMAFTGAGYVVQAAGGVGQAALDGAWQGVLATLNRYLDVGTLAPLRSGGGAGDLSPFFTSGAGPRVAPGAPDRAAFVDEGLPPATGVSGNAGPATLTALAGSDGTISVVTARLDLRLRAEVDGTSVIITRTGELVLMPEDGSWRIDAYDIRVNRDSPGARTTTTGSS